VTVDQTSTVARLSGKLDVFLLVRSEQGVDLGFNEIHAHVHVIVGEHTLENDGDGIPGLVDRQENNHSGGDGTPGEGDANPEVEVALVEDTATGAGTAASREGQARPDDNHDEGEANTPLLDPGEGVSELLRVGFSVFLEFRKLVIDELDAVVQRAEVKVLRVLEGERSVDDTRRADGNNVTGKHWVVHAESINGDGAFETSGNRDPGDKTEDETSDGADDGASAVRLVPGEDEGDRHDGGTDEDTHHEVDKAEGKREFIEDQRKETHEDAEGDDAIAGDTQDVFASGVRVDVLPVDIVREQGGDSNLLGRASGHDGHEKHDRDRGSTTLTQQVGSNGWRHETRAGFSGSHRQVESDGSETHGGGEGERNGEPDETAEEVTLGGGGRLGRDGGLPVRLVNEDGTEVTDNVNDTEDDATFRKHRQVGALLVLGNRTAVLAETKLFGAISLSHDRSQEVVHLARGAEFGVAGVHDVDEGNENGENDRGVDVRRQEGRLETTRHGVRDDTERDQETSDGRVHAGERVDGGGTTEHEHRRHDDVGEEAEEDEHLLHVGTPTSINDFANSVRVRSISLHLDGEHTEEQHLNRRAGRVPKRTRDAVLVRDVGRLQKSRRPGPLGDDDRRSQTSLNVTTSRVKVLRRHVRTTVTLIQAHDDRRGDGEEETETDHDAVTRTRREHGLTAEKAATRLKQAIKPTRRRQSPSIRGPSGAHQAPIRRRRRAPQKVATTKVSTRTVPSRIEEASRALVPRLTDAFGRRGVPRVVRCRFARSLRHDYRIRSLARPVLPSSHSSVVVIVHARRIPSPLRKRRRERV